VPNREKKEQKIFVLFYRSHRDQKSGKYFACLTAEVGTVAANYREALRKLELRGGVVSVGKHGVADMRVRLPDKPPSWYSPKLTEEERAKTWPHWTASYFEWLLAEVKQILP
jgi:hypothetical protein